MLDYKVFYPEEKQFLNAFLLFLENNINPFIRTNFKGHIIGSAFVLNKALDKALLTHHFKINKWFQLGGHSDNDNNPFRVALREAQEESGLKSLKFLQAYSGIFDLDIHEIPQYKDEPVHLHYDVRILLIADENEALKITPESKELKWVPLSEVHKYNNSPSILRLIDKVNDLKKAIAN